MTGLSTYSVIGCLVRGAVSDHCFRIYSARARERRAIANEIRGRSQGDPGRAASSQQRLCGDFRGLGFKVIPRVSHLWKLGHQGTADWRDRQEKGGWPNARLEHGVEHVLVGSASPSRSAPMRWAEACQVAAQKQPESGPLSAGPATAGSSLQVPGGSARRCRKGGAHVRSGHLNAWGSDITGCPAVSRRRAVTAALQGLPTHVCYDGHWMPSAWSSS